MAQKPDDIVKSFNNFRRQDQSYHFVKCLRVQNPFDEFNVLSQLKNMNI